MGSLIGHYRAGILENSASINTTLGTAAINKGGLMGTSYENAKIKNTDELEFAVFCIENVAIRLDKNAEDVYKV